MFIIGIDPGNTGGIAVLSASKGVPQFAFGMINEPHKFHNYLSSFTCPVEIWIEKAGSRPTDSHNSAWGNGFNYGKYIMSLEIIKHTIGTEYHEVHPKTWKSAFHLDKDKNKSKLLCEDLWQDESIRSMYIGEKGGFKDGVAEAMLIGYYGWLDYRRRLQWKQK